MLNLCNCPRVTDAGLSFLSPLRRLSRLLLVNCAALTDAGVSALAALRRLEMLDLSHTGTRITGAGFAAFAGRHSGTRLASLSLAYCTGLDDRGLALLCRALRGLARLNVWGCSALTDAGGTCLGRLSLLTGEAGGWLRAALGTVRQLGVEKTAWEQGARGPVAFESGGRVAGDAGSPREREGGRTGRGLGEQRHGGASVEQ